MKNFKQFLKSKKVTVYHVSPDSSIGKLRATGHHRGQQSIKMGKSGIYVAPKFRDAVAWAVSYVGGKKYNTQKPNERLKEKESGGGWHGEKGPRNYKHLTIYEIEAPKEVLQNSWSSSFWEPEYFISDEYLDQLNIIKSKTYSLDELIIISNKESQKRQEHSLARELIEIKKASKNNLAARFYLELINLYNQHLLTGHSPIISTDVKFHSKSKHLIRQKIDELKNYIHYSDDNWRTTKIAKLSSEQKKEVESLYRQIKSMIEG